MLLRARLISVCLTDFHLTEVSVSFAAGKPGDLFVFKFACRGERYDNWL